MSANGRATPQAPGQKPSETPILEEAVAVLCTVATERAPDRALAVRYTQARAAVQASSLKELLPPYFQQCVSVHKFHDFINLFAPDGPRRIAFIQQSFEPCRRAMGQQVRRKDFFAEDL